MKILILGTGKSGTTALLYKVAGGLPDCEIFSGGDPGPIQSDHENAVFKFTYNEDKGRTLDVFEAHVREVHYDRHIWIARDPRDVAISKLLFRWYRGSRRAKEQYRACLKLVLKKERDPLSVPVHTLLCLRGLRTPPYNLAQMLDRERSRYEQMYRFVEALGADWFIFRYEDMINRNFEALNVYLGFNVHADADVARSAKKVVRKKSIGDWRQWFTEEDVRLFKPIYSPYMDLIGYDSSDWELNPEPMIEPRYSSLYMKRLARRRMIDMFLASLARPPFLWKKIRQN